MTKVSFVILLTLGLAVAATSAGYLLTEEPGLRADPGNLTQVARGKTVYAENCAACHGADLEGETPDWRTLKDDGTLPAPPHNDSGHTWHHGDQLLFDYTHDGGQSIVPADFQSGMPAFGDQLSDDDIWAVLAFIKSNWSEANLFRQQKMTERETR